MIDDKSPVCCDVLTGISGSRLDQPSEFIDSLNDEDAILDGEPVLGMLVRSFDTLSAGFADSVMGRQCLEDVV